MSQSTQSELSREVDTFTGALTVARIRLMIVVAAFAAFAYYVLMAP